MAAGTDATAYMAGMTHWRMSVAISAVEQISHRGLEVYQESAACGG